MKIAEIFKSIQGEGIYAGVEQVFVRLFGCNLKCSFCDTPLERYDEKSVSQIVSEVRQFGKVHSISLTGGEPLMQIEDLIELSKSLKNEGYLLYLETNGILYENLTKVIEYIDIIAMDFKLPTTTDQQSLWEDHREFLKIAKGKDVFVKVVIGKLTQIGDVLEALKIIKDIKSDLTLVLQPENPFEHALGGKVAFFKMLAKLHGMNIKVIPQKHKQLGIR
ncbi:MAG: 7-carboxy-7-deazaguanine synthase QueE [Candidatus Omnitrophica bacterium]|nr:7-carboxy-7-deazaguanine synthase QueE [Candidatus Omnitrophota bacterium]